MENYEGGHARRHASIPFPLPGRVSLGLLRPRHVEGPSDRERLRYRVSHIGGYSPLAAALLPGHYMWWFMIDAVLGLDLGLIPILQAEKKAEGGAQLGQLNK